MEQFRDKETKRRGNRPVLQNGNSTATPDKEPYQALTKARGRQMRLRTHGRDGEIRLYGYSYLVEVVALPASKMISLVFTNCVLTILGDNLFKGSSDSPSLIELIQDDQVRSLHWFDPAQYQQPGEGELVITEFRRQTFDELGEQ